MDARKAHATEQRITMHDHPRPRLGKAIIRGLRRLAGAPVELPPGDRKARLEVAAARNYLTELVDHHLHSTKSESNRRRARRGHGGAGDRGSKPTS